jgi:hypothetical protein
VARIGLLPRVRCLRSLIYANTPRGCPLPNFPVAAVDAIFPFLACLIILSRVCSVQCPGNPHE